eukprot:TRINITY_DN92501_c0_g1_i1.p1 TRINITY_DN92501_c0_g1~~TRINITY_DN92501_c0_g1_i1.p1  ORF type:complete len:804 (+),score=252.16 TRINITY_DN92501_c0_g1_i1:137-2413(+)
MAASTATSTTFFKGGGSEYDPMLQSGAGLQGYEAHRMYDMCMVFKYKTSKNVKFEEPPTEQTLGRQLVEPSEQDKSKMIMLKQRREGILKSLQSCGLHVYCFYSRDRDEIFVKIGAEAQKLRDTAARLKYRLQLKPEYLSAYAEYRHDFAGRPELNFTDRRVVSHFYKTHSEDNYPGDDAIFTTMDKIFLIHHIITAKDKDCAGINVGGLIHEQELKAYFPLHEASKLKKLKASRMDWVRMDQAHSDRVRDYFGDKIAFYFLWMSFYVKWLLPVAALGLVKQVLDFLCRSPDNVTAVPFCVLLSVWAAFLPHFWRRQESKYTIQWGSFSLQEKLEPVRAEHWGEPRINPVTGQVEPFYPFNQRIWRYAVSGVVVVFSGCVLTAIVLLLVLAKHLYPNAVMMGTMGHQFVLAAVVEFVNGVLGRVSRKLTEWENHRTKSEHESQRLAKVMGFKFVNSYFVLYYIAFFKRHGYLFGIEMDCYRQDCFLDLQSQLAIFVIFRIVFQNLVELFGPRLKQLYTKWILEGQNFFNMLQGQNILELADMSAAEKESKQAAYEAFGDFDEALLTHGYSTLFAVTSPWVCAATLVAIFIEVQIDAKKITEMKQRPLPEQARNNEPWSTAFHIYGIVAVFTNVFLLVFCSHQYEAWTLTEKLTLFVFLEHLVLLFRLLFVKIFPEVPKSVELLQLKQDHIVHRCLENIRVEGQQDFSMFRDQKQDQIEIFDTDHLEDEADLEEPEMNIHASSLAIYEGLREETPLLSR